MPVSYTHLDVYKRQVFETFFAQPLEAVWAGARLERAAAQDRGAGSLDHLRRLQDHLPACLLYTSRCV